jgi:cysteine desulfurase family protein
MIYLNNSATTYPKPKEVIDAVHNTLISIPDGNLRTGASNNGKDIKNTCRENLNDFFDTQDENKQMTLNSGSTIGLNTVIHGLELEGKHIIATDSEHNAVIRPLSYLKNNKNVGIDFAPCDETGFVEPDDIKKLVKKNTALIVLNHCSNVTGTYQDVKSIAHIAHNNNALILVDSSQSAGALDFSVNELDIDIMAFTGHKSLYGIQGTGGLYIKSGLELEPLVSGGTGIMGESEYQPDKMPYKFEAGTSNIAGFAALNEGVNWVRKTGMENIHNKKKHLVEKMISAFEGNPKIKIYKSETHNSYTLFAFNVIGEVPEEINFILENSFDIKIRSGIHCAPRVRKAINSYPYGTLRVSPSYFTKEEEVVHFIESLNKILDGYK